MPARKVLDKMHLVALVVAESVGKLLQGAADQASLLPQVGGQEAVGVGDGSEGSLQGVLQSLGRAGRRGVDVLNTSKLKETLDGGGGDQGGTTGGGDQANSDGAALAALLDGDGVGETQVGAPETATDGDDAQLGDDDGGTDGSGNLLGGLDAQTDVALGVTNDDDGLEAGALTGTGLLLDGLDLCRGEKLAHDPKQAYLLCSGFGFFWRERSVASWSSAVSSRSSLLNIAPIQKLSGVSASNNSHWRVAEI